MVFFAINNDGGITQIENFQVGDEIASAQIKNNHLITNGFHCRNQITGKIESFFIFRKENGIWVGRFEKNHTIPVSNIYHVFKNTCGDAISELDIWNNTPLNYDVFDVYKEDDSFDIYSSIGGGYYKIENDMFSEDIRYDFITYGKYNRLMANHTVRLINKYTGFKK